MMLRLSSDAGRAWLARVAALLALTVLGIGASGLPLPVRAAEQEVVRQGVMNGAYKPLTAIIAELGRQHPGRVVDVESKRGLQGDLRYEITLVDAAGRKHELLVDAATGRVISQDQDVLRQAANMGQLAAYLRRVEQQQGRRVVDVEYEVLDYGKSVYQLRLASGQAVVAHRLLMDAQTGALLDEPGHRGAVPAIRSMPDMLQALDGKFPGQVIEVELEDGGTHSAYYEIELMQDDGGKLELQIDARSLAVLKRKLED
ncbi:peptidase [Comamonadaceae bacterium OH2545_COT-014]|nr:peptidase [Comamonadaceae bacterium OH2545_COT-014]